MEANKLALDLLESAHYELGLYDNFWPFLKNTGHVGLKKNTGNFGLKRKPFTGEFTGNFGLKNVSLHEMLALKM